MTSETYSLFDPCCDCYLRRVCGWQKIKGQCVPGACLGLSRINALKTNCFCPDRPHHRVEQQVFAWSPPAARPRADPCSLLAPVCVGEISLSSESSLAHRCLFTPQQQQKHFYPLTHPFPPQPRVRSAGKQNQTHASTVDQATTTSFRKHVHCPRDHSARHFEQTSHQLQPEHESRERHYRT